MCGLLGGRNQPGRVADRDGARPDCPAVQSEPASERTSDAAEDVQVLGAGVRVDGGDDATLSDGVHADQRAANSNRVPRPGGFGLLRYTADEQVWPQPAHVVPKSADGAIGGDQEVEYVEPFGAVVPSEHSICTGVLPHESAGRIGVPRVTCDQWNTVGTCLSR